MRSVERQGDAPGPEPGPADPLLVLAALVWDPTLSRALLATPTADSPTARSAAAQAAQAALAAAVHACMVQRAGVLHDRVLLLRCLCRGQAGAAAADAAAAERWTQRRDAALRQSQLELSLLVQSLVPEALVLSGHHDGGGAADAPMEPAWLQLPAAPATGALPLQLAQLATAQEEGRSKLGGPEALSGLLVPVVWAGALQVVNCMGEGPWLPGGRLRALLELTMLAHSSSSSTTGGDGDGGDGGSGGSTHSASRQATASPHAAPGAGLQPRPQEEGRTLQDALVAPAATWLLAALPEWQALPQVEPLLVPAWCAVGARLCTRLAAAARAWAAAGAAADGAPDHEAWPAAAVDKLQGALLLLQQGQPAKAGKKVQAALKLCAAQAAVGAPSVQAVDAAAQPARGMGKARRSEQRLAGAVQRAAAACTAHARLALSHLRLARLPPASLHGLCEHLVVALALQLQAARGALLRGRAGPGPSAHQPAVVWALGGAVHQALLLCGSALGALTSAGQEQAAESGGAGDGAADASGPLSVEHRRVLAWLRSSCDLVAGLIGPGEPTHLPGGAGTGGEERCGVGVDSGGGDAGSVMAAAAWVMQGLVDVHLQRQLHVVGAAAAAVGGQVDGAGGAAARAVLRDTVRAAVHALEGAASAAGPGGGREVAVAALSCAQQCAALLAAAWRHVAAAADGGAALEPPQGSSAAGRRRQRRACLAAAGAAVRAVAGELEELERSLRGLILLHAPGAAAPAAPAGSAEGGLAGSLLDNCLLAYASLVQLVGTSAAAAAAAPPASAPAGGRKRNPAQRDADGEAEGGDGDGGGDGGGALLQSLLLPQARVREVLRAVQAACQGQEEGSAMARRSAAAVAALSALAALPLLPGAGARLHPGEDEEEDGEEEDEEEGPPHPKATRRAATSPSAGAAQQRPAPRSQEEPSLHTVLLEAHVELLAACCPPAVCGLPPPRLVHGAHEELSFDLRPGDAWRHVARESLLASLRRVRSSSCPGPADCAAVRRVLQRFALVRLCCVVRRRCASISAARLRAQLQHLERGVRHDLLALSGGAGLAAPRLVQRLQCVVVLLEVPGGPSTTAVQSKASHALLALLDQVLLHAAATTLASAPAAWHAAVTVVAMRAVESMVGRPAMFSWSDAEAGSALGAVARLFPAHQAGAQRHRRDRLQGALCEACALLTSCVRHRGQAVRSSMALLLAALQGMMAHVVVWAEQAHLAAEGRQHGRALPRLAGAGAGGAEQEEVGEQQAALAQCAEAMARVQEALVQQQGQEHVAAVRPYCVHLVAAYITHVAMALPPPPAVSFCVFSSSF